MKDKIVLIAAILANLGMIVFISILMTRSYGDDSKIAIILLIPPILSLLALWQSGDFEERRLRKLLRKASLRKQLKELEEFTK